MSKLSTIRSYPYTIIAILFFTILAIFLCLRRQQGDWEGTYIPGAERLARGEDIYQGDFVHPPFNAWLPLPFVGLPRLPARLLWFVITAGSLTVLVCGAWSLSGGGRLQGNPPVARREHLIFGLGLLCAAYYCLDVFTNQQIDLVIAALTIAGCCALVRGRDALGGIAIGLAAAIKCTPLLASCYLVWKRRWLGAVLIPVTAIAANLIPDVTHPRTGSATRFEEWAHVFLMPMGNRGHDFGTWGTAIIHNHSLAGVCNRWLTHQASWQDGKLQDVVSKDRVSPEMLKGASLGSMLFFVAGALMCSWKAARGDGACKPRGDAPRSSPMALEFSLLVILMLLLSPQSSKPHFCTLFLPGFCLARAALVRNHRLLLALVLAAVACGLASNKDLVGARVYDWMLWHGSVTLSAVLLFAGCCLALVGRQRSVALVSEGAKPELRKAA